MKEKPVNITIEEYKKPVFPWKKTWNVYVNSSMIGSIVFNSYGGRREYYYRVLDEDKHSFHSYYCKGKAIDEMIKEMYHRRDEFSQLLDSIQYISEK